MLNFLYLHVTAYKILNTCMDMVLMLYCLVIFSAVHTGSGAVRICTLCKCACGRSDKCSGSNKSHNSAENK